MMVDVHLEMVDDDVVLGVVFVDGARIEFAANILYVGRRLEVTKVHLHGGGAHSLGARGLRCAVQALMVELDVDQVTVEGGARVTGAATGRHGTGPRTPRRLYFTREPS